MHDQRLPPRAPSASRGRASTTVAIFLALLIAASLALLYKPWQRLQFGSFEPPIPASKDLESALAERIEQRLDGVRASPYDALAWGKLAETYDVHGLFAEADACYLRASVLAPKEARWHYLRGVLLSVGDQRQAIASFERTLALQPELAPAHFRLGQLYLATDRLADAQAQFARALELEPNALAARIGLANAALANKNPQQALEQLETVRSAGLDGDEVRRLLASTWRALGDEAKAQSFADREGGPLKKTAFPDPLLAQLQRDEGVTLKFARARAELLLERGETNSALAELNGYLEKSPRSAPALAALADLYLRLDRVDDAIARYQAACTLDSTNAAAFSQWGAALTRAGRSDEGVEKLRQAVALEPASVDFRANLGSMLCGSQQAERRQEGLSLLADAAKQRPEDVTLSLNLAQALRANQRPDESAAAFQHALELAPGNVRAHFEYGVLLAQMARYEDAAKAFARVIELDPSRAQAHDNLIWTLTRMGRHREAIAALRQAMQSLPANAAMRGQLAWLLATSPDDGARSGAEALAIARELVEKSGSKNSELLVLLAAAQAETGDFSAATQSANQALELLKPKEDMVTDPALVAIIERALSCLRAFEAGKAYRSEQPPQ